MYFAYVDDKPCQSGWLVITVAGASALRSTAGAVLVSVCLYDDSDCVLWQRAPFANLSSEFDHNV